jgi:hypothetical protein
MLHKKIIYDPEPTDEKWIEDFNAAIQQCMNSPYYKKRCEESGFSGKISSFAELKTVPYISDWEFKLTNKEHEQLLCVPKEDIHVYTISSSTTGNPSFVPRTKDDVEIFQKNFGNVSFKASGGKLDSTLYVMPPLEMLIKQTTINHNGTKAQLYGLLVNQGINEIYGGEKGYGEIVFLIKLSLFKTILKTAKERKKTAVFDKKISTFVDFCKKVQNTEKKIQFGGTTIPTFNFLKEINEKGLFFDLKDQTTVIVGTGGWDGKKGINKTDPIAKESFAKLVGNIFGTNAFYDIYGTSESPVFFHGQYDAKLKDTVHTPMKTTKIMIRDHYSGKILTNANDIGLLQIMTPYGSEGSPQANILTGDLVKIHETGNDGLVSSFLYVERAKSKIDNQVDKGGCGDFLSKKI